MLRRERFERNFEAARKKADVKAQQDLQIVEPGNRAVIPRPPPPPAPLPTVRASDTDTCTHYVVSSANEDTGRAL